MDCNKKISVCIPCYNIEACIPRCLDSILGNTYPNLEVICVNDGSTDDSSAILHQYAGKDSRVIVIDKENGGVVSARKAALDIATGDFISFVDGDDWVHHQFFEILMSLQQKSGADVVICNYQKCTDYTPDTPLQAEAVSYTASDLSIIFKVPHARSYVWGRIYARDLVPEQMVSNQIVIGEDTALNFLFLGKKEPLKIAVTSESLYYYFQREGSLVRTVQHAEKIHVSIFLKEHFDLFHGPQSQAAVLREILRTMLTYRYLKMYSPQQADIQACCKTLYMFCAAKWRGVFRTREQMQYRILYACPGLYRLFRIVTDPSMLDWERAEKRRQSEAKRD